MFLPTRPTTMRSMARGSAASPVILSRVGIALLCLIGLLFAGCAVNQNAQVEPVIGCEGFGPQTPRDIDNGTGLNKRVFSIAPDHEEMNLCNIHFHANAEHKAEAFSIFAGEGENGYGSGYKCAIGESLSEAELTPLAENHCAGIKSGDTVEVHWVHSSCDVAPGPTLGACLDPDRCMNPNLRVETQVFVAVNDRSAINFADLSYDGNIVDGYHQAKAIPNTTGDPVQFLGSTTGPSFSDSVCSPLQVSWSVRPQCAKVDIKSLSTWCKDNVFDEKKAHGVRALVTDPELLSTFE